MRNIESRLKALERKAVKHNSGDFCFIHVPPPVIRFTDGVEVPTEENPEFCPICKKNYSPDRKQVVIEFFCDSSWN